MPALLLPLLATLALSPPALADGRPPPQQKGQKQGGHPRKGKKPQPHWESEPFVKPEAGATISGSGGSASAFATVGASAGIRYWRVGDPPPMWNGQTRVRGAYGTGGGNSSLDARVGSFIGPSWKQVGLLVGPDLFWNQYDLASGQDLEPSVGVEVPLTASFRVSKQISLFAGVAPAWLTNPDRAVDWDEVSVPGFGDEFAYSAGVGLNLDAIKLNLSYSYRIVANGVQQGVGVGVTLGL